MKLQITKIFLFISIIFLGTPLTGQKNQAPLPDLNSPYNAAYVHLYYLQPESYDVKTAALALFPIEDSLKMEKRAIQLKQIFDGKGLFMLLNQIPSQPDYLDSATLKNFYTPFPKELPQIYLERDEGKWKYSAESVSKISKLHQKVYPLGADFLLKILPKNATASFLGLALWQWLGFILLLVLAYILHLLLSRIIRPILNFIANSRLNLEFIDIRHLKALAKLCSLLLIGWFLRMSIPALLLPIKTSSALHKGISFVVILITMFIALEIVNIVADRGRTLALKTTSRMDEQLIPILTRISKIIIVIIAIIYILGLLNVNITALIAGISIGGLALALAAQDTVKNLIGSVMIFTDQPFQLGDYISGGDYEGTVEEIGFRTTRIRTLDTSIIAVPNGVISNSSINNWGVRKMRLFNIILGVTYNSTSNQISSFISQLKSLILKHRLTNKESYYVHFKEMADSSLNIMFRCYLEVPGYAEELAAKEEIMLEIMKIAESLDISFAFPSQSVYIESNKKG